MQCMAHAGQPTLPARWAHSGLNCPIPLGFMSPCLQICSCERLWPARTYPESEFSPASLNVAQMVVKIFCPFLCQTHAFFFFFLNNNISYFHLSSQREIHLLWRTGNWLSSSLSSVPMVTVLCLQGTEPCRTRGSGCCVSSTCIRRFYRFEKF